jgi:hypothetical protein
MRPCVEQIWSNLMKGADTKAAEVMEQAFAGFETK